MKLHQNRIVIVGRNYQDAYAFGQTDRFKDELEAPVLVTSASHRLHILGSLGGMHVGTAYVTETAHEGENFPVVEEALERLAKVNPDMIILEQPRVVHA